MPSTQIWVFACVCVISDSHNIPILSPPVPTFACPSAQPTSFDLVGWMPNGHESVAPKPTCSPHIQINKHGGQDHAASCNSS
jgi:hypothetical protein